LLREKVSALLAYRDSVGDFEVDPEFRAAALDVLAEPYLGDARAGTDRFEMAANARGHCYLLDEPERHLHPAVARKAARWLRGVMASRPDTQCVLTTHSVPFVDLGDDASYNYLWRDGPRVFSTQFHRRDIDELKLMTEEMGFDRGELLTSVQQLLFVEGRADQTVLETLFGRDLRRLGVVVVPIHSVGRLQRVAEAEVLFRLTSARIRVLVDNDIANTVPALRSDREQLESALRQKKNTELQAVAQLLRTAIQAERDSELEVLSIPVADMFFLLDDGIIGELYRDYPGHDEAETAWLEMRQQTGQQIGRKRFRADRYKVPDDLGMYSHVAMIMRERDVLPLPLVHVVNRLAEWSD
jgi:putative AbiEii toxin of type IV toxin-antitoxin system